MSGAAAVAAPAAPPVAAAPIPWLGLFGVLLGTFISTLTGRLSTFGLADIRGAVHAGFDEGAWITTSFTVAQMLITPTAVWIGNIYGQRRILIGAALFFALTSIVTPFCQNLTLLLALQFLSGLGTGCFIPLTLSFVLRNMPRPYWAYGVALYALNLELSLNISASLEAWYIDNLNWHWIFWQNVPLALGMAACLFFGVKHAPSPGVVHRDIYGLASCGVGLALIYAALDQGNRLNWTSSGIVCGLILGGSVLVIGFIIHGLTTPFPWLNFAAAFRWPMPLLLTNVMVLRLTVLATAYLIPYYLGGVRGFRSMQVGETLLWIGLPQLVLCPLAAILMRHIDPRIIAVAGLSLIILACMSVAYTLTPLWGPEQFLPSQLLQAVGQSFALSGVVFIAVLNLRPEDAAAAGAIFQITRLFGGELGSAFITTEARLREQRASALLGQHIQAGSLAAQQRLTELSQLLRHGGQARAAPELLDRLVRLAATTQATIDGFVAVACVSVVTLVIVVLLLPPPKMPAPYMPLFHWHPTE